MRVWLLLLCLALLCFGLDGKKVKNNKKTKTAKVKKEKVIVVQKPTLGDQEPAEALPDAIASPEAPKGQRSKAVKPPKQPKVPKPDTVNEAPKSKTPKEPKVQEPKAPKVPKEPKPVPKLQELKESGSVFVPDLAKIKYVKAKPKMTGSQCSCGCQHCHKAQEQAPPTNDAPSQTNDAASPGNDAASQEELSSRVADALKDPNYVYMKLVPVESLPEEGSSEASCPIFAIPRRQAEQVQTCFRFLKSQAENLQKATGGTTAGGNTEEHQESLLEHAIHDVQEATERKLHDDESQDHGSDEMKSEEHGS